MFITNTNIIVPLNKFSCVTETKKSIASIIPYDGYDRDTQGGARA